MPVLHPYVLLVLAALFWAGNVVLGRGITGQIPPVTLNVLRWAIALAVLMPFARPQLAGQRNLILANFGGLVLLAVPSIAIYNTCIYLGTQTTTAADAGLIVGTMPIAILVIAALAGDEMITLRRAAAIAISFAGVVCVIAKGSPAVVQELAFSPGDILIVGAVVAWAVYTVLLRRLAIPLGAFALLAVLSVIGLALCIPFCAWELARGARIQWSAETVMAILYVGIFPSVVATIFWNEAVAAVGAGTAGVFSNLIPVFCVLLAVVLLSEPLRLFHLIGTGLIFTGIWLAARPRSPSRRLA